MAKQSAKEKTDYDPHWKRGITDFFRPFLELFFPHIAADVDWGRGWESLDKELLPENADDEVGRRDADLLFRVYRSNGEESWVLIHVEVQSQNLPPTVLEERVWVYTSRIRLRYQKRLCCLVVLADLSRDWKPERFLEELWGFEISLRFPTVKLLELEKKLKTEPTLSRNPFARITRIHLAAKRSTPNSAKRRSYKREFLLELLKAMRDGELDIQGMDQVKKLLSLLDGFLSLSAENDKLFKEELEHDEEIQQMKQETPYITTFERWAREEERQRAEEERQRVEQLLQQERQRAEQLAKRLRELGVDPDTL